MATAVVTAAMFRTWAGEVASHRVHVVRQVFPRPGDSLHLGLAAQLAFGAHFTRHARHFRREHAELINHRVDGSFQFLNLTFDVDGDFFR